MTVGCMVGGENDYACHAGSGLTNVVQHQMDMNTNPGGYGGGAASYYASPGSSYHGGGPGTPGTTPGPHTTYPGGPMSPYTPGGAPMSPYSQGQSQSPTGSGGGGGGNGGTATGGSSGSLYSNQSSPYSTSAGGGGYPPPPFHQPIPGGYHYGNHSPTYGQYGRLPVSHPGGMLPSPVRIPHPMNSPNQNLSSMGGPGPLKTEPMDLKGNGPFSQAYNQAAGGGFSGFNSNYPPHRPPTSSPMSPGCENLAGGTPSHDSPHHLQEGGNLAPSSSNMSPGGPAHMSGSMNSNMYNNQLQHQQQNSPGTNFPHTPQPQYPHGLGSEWFPPTSQAPTSVPSQPSPSQSSLSGGIKKENTAAEGGDNGDDNHQQGFNYDDRLKSSGGVPPPNPEMSDLPSDFRQQQHCIKPSLSPGGAGGGEEGLMPPHMGEYGMGEEHKDDGYGGPEMGSWQMPGMEGYPPPHLQYPNQQQMWANFYNSGGGGGPEDHHNGGRYHGAMSPHMIGGGGPMEAWWQGGSGPIPGDPAGYRLPGPLPGMHPGAPGPWAMRGSRSRNDRRGPGRPRMTKGDRPEPGSSPFYPGPEGMPPEMLANVGSPGEMKRGPGRPKSMMEAGGPKMPDTTKNGNKKRYTCEVCQKRFSTAWYVRVHRRSHNGERPYVCNNCGKGFMLPNVLQVHLRKCEKNNPPGAGSSTTPGGPPGGHPGEGGGPPDQSPIHPGSGPGMGVGGGVPGGPSGLPPSTSYGFVEAGGGPGGHLPPHSQPHQIQGMGAFNQRYLGDMTPPHMSGHQPPYPPPHGMEMGQPPYGVPGVVGPDRYSHHPGLDGHSPNQFSPLYSPNSGGSGGMPPISSATNSESSNSEHHFLAIDKPRDKGGGLDSMMIPSPASSSGGSGGDHASAFIRHPSQAGSGTNQTNYCNACDQRFEDKAATEEHMKTHRPFPCEICDRRFSQKCNLVTHLRLHTGEKPYACDFCDKRFTQKGNLDAHIKTHTKEKPFQCTLCNKKFSFKSSLQTHTRNHEAGTLSLDVDEDDIETLKQHARMMNQQAQLDSDSNLASGTPPTDYSGGEDGGVSGAGGGSLPPSPGSGHLHTEYGATVQLQNHQLYSGSVTPGGTSGPDADISKLTSADSRQTVAML